VVEAVPNVAGKDEVVADAVAGSVGQNGASLDLMRRFPPIPKEDQSN